MKLYIPAAQNIPTSLLHASPRFPLDSNGECRRASPSFRICHQRIDGVQINRGWRNWWQEAEDGVAGASEFEF